jgi:hypothetical protein
MLRQALRRYKGVAMVRGNFTLIDEMSEFTDEAAHREDEHRAVPAPSTKYDQKARARRAAGCRR